MNTATTTKGSQTPSNVNRSKAREIPATDVAFKDEVGFQGGMTADKIGDLVAKNPRLAFLGLVELRHNQAIKEKGEVKNRIRFSRKHLGRVSQLLEKFDKEGFRLAYTNSEIKDACIIAKSYREQLWLICLGIQNAPLISTETNASGTPPATSTDVLAREDEFYITNDGVIQKDWTKN